MISSELKIELLMMQPICESGLDQSDAMTHRFFLNLLKNIRIYTGYKLRTFLMIEWDEI